MFQKRLYEIDLLRFIAAIMVVFFHYTADSFHEYHVYLTDNQFFNNILLQGHLGVQLFFLISGFVILMSAQFSSPSKFVKSRVIRLYPAFIPICIFTYIIGKAFLADYNVSFRDLLLNITLVGTFAFWAKANLVSGVYWTLIVEMQFYFFIWLLLVFNKMNFIRTFLFAWLTLSVLTYYGEIYFNYHHLFNKLRMLFITEHSYFFISGCYFYLIRHETNPWDKAMVLISGFFSVFLFDKGNLLFITSVFLITFYVVFALIAFQLINLKKYPETYKSLGNLTYPLYLIHEILGIMLIGLLLPYLNKSLLLVLLVVFVIIITYLFNIYVEAKLTTRLKHFLDKRTPVKANN